MELQSSEVSETSGQETGLELGSESPSGGAGGEAVGGEGGSKVAGGVQISALAARVLGSLLEKEFATPDVYPLTLNSLTNACNQKSNRDPILSVSSREVELGLEELRRHRLATVAAGSEARVPKFKQKLDWVFPMGEEERAIMCELLVRGPQTTAGLRANAERLYAMPGLEACEELLRGLEQRAVGPLVRRLPRQTGQKEARWAQLLTGEPEAGAGEGEAPVRVEVALPPEVSGRLEALEAEVRGLKEQLAQIRRELGMAESSEG
jgi:uncharacterized protein YceH (UPF0502 family)